jgi:hypothetical protein
MEEPDRPVEEPGPTVEDGDTGDEPERPPKTPPPPTPDEARGNDADD